MDVINLVNNSSGHMFVSLVLCPPPHIVSGHFDLEMIFLLKMLVNVIVLD